MERTWDRRTFLRNVALVGAGTVAADHVLAPDLAKADSSPARSDRDLDRFLRRRLADSNCPGLGLAAVYDGRVAWSGGLGLANVRRSQQVRRDTMFMLASISKTVTATALMQVWEQGTIDLDADVNDVLPFPVRNPAFPSRPITARQLLTHTSGIRDNWSELIPLYVKGDSPIALRTFLKRYLVRGGAHYSASKNFAGWRPGTGYLYSNVGAALIGYLVEAVTDVDFARWCERRIFDPLGMSDTGWHLRGLDRDRVARPYRRRADGSWTSYGLYGYPDYPDGGLRTTARSLAKFLAAYSRGGGPILKSSTVDLMLRDQKVPGPWQGMVWYRTSGPGGYLIGHGGADSGVRTEMWFRRDDGAGAIVLANGDARGGNADLKAVRDRLIREARSLAR